MIDLDRFSDPHDKYNIFNLKINLASNQSLNIFSHEYYHHLQNVTTIHGAERFNLFIQLIAHIAHLGNKKTTLKLPLTKWNPEEKRIQQDIDNILNHLILWDYLEKKDIYRHSFSEKDLGSITEGPTHPEGAVTPCYVQKHLGEIIGYPIGGFTLSESSAFSVEQIFSNNPMKVEDLEPKYYNFEYHLLPYLLSKLTGSGFREIYELTFMASELIYSISTPSMGFLLLYTKLFSEIGTISDFKQRLVELSKEWDDMIEDNIDSELGMLDVTRQTSTDLSRELKEMIDWQLKQLQKGLKMRKENPYFIAEKLLKEKGDGIIWLINEFPPTVIQIEREEANYFEINHYTLLDILSKIAINLVYTPHKLIDEIADKCQIEYLNRSKSKVNIKVKDESRTDPWGYALRMLNLNEFSLEFI